MRVIITGGGTGGHISPAVAVIEELRRRDPFLLLQWAGRRGGREEAVCKKLEIPFRPLSVEGWPRNRSLRRLWAGGKLAIGVLQAALRLRAFQPQIVFGVGGYVSLPMMWAAQRLGYPTFLHEQNKRLGMANRMLAPRATRIFMSYDDTEGVYPRERARVVGNPVRAGFQTPPSKSDARQRLGLEPARQVVFIFGGSQGARSLNKATADMVPLCLQDAFQVLWMTGEAGAADARRTAETADVRCEVFPYVEDMVTACAAADVVVCRSGASSTAELAVLGKPSILVPFPHATDNHQEFNARAFEAAGAAVVILDSDCNGERLKAVLQELLAAPERLEAMGRAARSLAKPLAAEAIVEEMLTYVFSEEAPIAEEEAD